MAEEQKATKLSFTQAFGARYGEVSCHNKKEMISYLDRIIQVSGNRPSNLTNLT